MILAFLVFPVGVDEENLLTSAGSVLVDDQHTRRDARAIKQVARQTDDRFENALLDEPLTAGSFFAASEEDTMRHDHSQLPIALERGNHVLHEHQVGLLAALRHEVREPLLELHLLEVVVLRERRIGDHSVEPTNLTMLVEMQRLLERVALPDVGATDAMQQHVHLADGPSAAVEFLPRQFQIAGIAARFLNVLLRLDQHAARPDRRIVDAHAFLRFNNLHIQSDHSWRREELAPFFSGTVGKVFDEVVVGGSQQVGELEVVVAQRDAIEVLDEFDQGAVIHHPLADPAVEVDPLENILQRVRVGVFDSGKSLVQPGPNRRFQVGDPVVATLVVGVAPASFIRHEEIVLVRVGKLLLDQVGLQLFGGVLSPQTFPVFLKLVVESLQKQHPEDVFLELRGIHVASQDVARFKQLSFQPRQRQPFGLLLGDRKGRGR